MRRLPRCRSNLALVPAVSITVSSPPGSLWHKAVLTVTLPCASVSSIPESSRYSDRRKDAVQCSLMSVFRATDRSFCILVKERGEFGSHWLDMIESHDWPPKLLLDGTFLLRGSYGVLIYKGVRWPTQEVPSTAVLHNLRSYYCLRAEHTEIYHRSRWWLLHPRGFVMATPTVVTSFSFFCFLFICTLGYST